MIAKIFLWALGGLTLFVLWAVMRTPSPEEEAKSRLRRAIDLCWEEQSRKSLPPEQARFIAGACEKMESDFRSTYRVNP